MTGKQLYLIGYISCMAQAMRFNLFEGEWHDGNVPIMGPRRHAAWLGSTVFDGARAFEGVAPDLDRHCARDRVHKVHHLMGRAGGLS